MFLFTGKRIPESEMKIRIEKLRNRLCRSVALTGYA